MIELRKTKCKNVQHLLLTSKEGGWGAKHSPPLQDPCGEPLNKKMYFSIWLAFEALTAVFCMKKCAEQPWMLQKVPTCTEEGILNGILESWKSWKITLSFWYSAHYMIFLSLIPFLETLNTACHPHKISQRLDRVNWNHMSLKNVKITDFVETWFFALRATLKKELEESASHPTLLPCLSKGGAAFWKLFTMVRSTLLQPFLQGGP